MPPIKALMILASAAALTLVAPLSPVGLSDPAMAQTSAKKPYSLKGTSYLPARRPAYRYLKKSDTFESRKFREPSLGQRAQGQPFDNGFFFETPTGPFGGYTPYMH